MFCYLILMELCDYVNMKFEERKFFFHNVIAPQNMSIVLEKSIECFDQSFFSCFYLFSIYTKTYCLKFNVKLFQIYKHVFVCLSLYLVLFGII